VWIVIRIAASIIRDEAWARFVAVIAFTIATLNILNLLTPTANLLHSVGLHIGDVYISVLTLLQAAAILAVLLWVASVLARVLERRIRSVHGLNPSMQVLTGKLLKLALLLIAILIALRSVGVDLTAFAVFTGAVGVGVGLGLQRIVSNLISGIILLLDRSIKPGDVIELQDTFGWVSSLGARYTSVTTRDGKEWLIPNEDLITQRVVNWSFSSERLRLSIPFGISYDSDVRLAMNLAIDSAQAVSRVLQEPPPACRLIAFGNSSIDLELRLWINDPASGVANVRSAVLLGMWDRFKEQGVHIPFPQRDLHIKDGTVGVKDGTVGPPSTPAAAARRYERRANTGAAHSREVPQQISLPGGTSLQRLRYRQALARHDSHVQAACRRGAGNRPCRCSRARSGAGRWDRRETAAAGRGHPGRTLGQRRLSRQLVSPRILKGGWPTPSASPASMANSSI
jgi:small-conductance mechanosensitive channel